MLISVIIVVLFLSILILVHEFGHFLTAKKFGLLVEEFGIGLPPRIWGKKIRETIYSINALPFGGFVKILGENRDDIDSAASRSFSSLSIWKRSLVLAAGVFMNFFLGWLVLSSVFAIGVKEAVIITDVAPRSPAAEVGIISGDKVLNFVKMQDLTKYIDENKGREISLKVKRDGKVINLKAVPRLNPPAGQGSLGVTLVEAGFPKQNIASSLWNGLKSSIEIIKLTFVAIANLIIKAVTGNANLSQVSGPVGIVKITTQAGSLGFVYLLQLLALISLNLAVINIFPIPALDGGRIFFLLIEKIKGSPLPAKFERYANAVGMAVLLLLMVFITIKDVSKLF